MKFALLSDIHGNVEALRAVLTSAKSKSVEKYLIAGDLMGYYYRLPEVMSELKALNTCLIRGNHEDMFFEWQNDPDKRQNLEKKYGQSFIYNQDHLSSDELALLKNLPISLELEIDGFHVLMCHGSPWDPLQYIYPDTSGENVDRFFSYGKDVIIFGHSHYPVLWEREGRFVVNPGSVGQPRDRLGGACWALLDTDKNTIELQRELYDILPVIADCERFSPDQTYLKDILKAEGQKV